MNIPNNIGGPNFSGNAGKIIKVNGSANFNNGGNKPFVEKIINTTAVVAVAPFAIAGAAIYAGIKIFMKKK